MMMIQMQVTPEEARKLIGSIPHKTCQTGLQKNWREGGKAGVTAQSICWLYCWAKTGMNSSDAAIQARRAFNKMKTVCELEYRFQPNEIIRR